MTRSRRVVMMVVLAAVACAGIPVAAQSGEDAFTARLEWVPTTVRDRPNVTGKGSATARLSGATLSITGSFEGLAAPATVARLHEGVAVGARGPAIGDLTITKASSGTISGAVTLTAAQIEHLREGKLYVQVHCEKGVEEDGSTLWGWLLR